MLAKLAVRLLAAGGVALAGLAVVITLHFLTQGWGRADIIYPGVKALGVEVGGLGRAEAREALWAAAEGYGRQTFTWRFGAWERPATLEGLGVTLDREALLEEAYAVGRAGTSAERWDARVAALHGRYQVWAKVGVDPARWEAAMADLAQAISRPATNAQLLISPNGSVHLVPGVAGQRLNAGETARRLAQALSNGFPSSVDLMVDAVPPRLTEDDFQTAKAQAEGLLAGPWVLRYQQRRWTLSPAELAPALRIQQTNGQPQIKLQLESEPLRGFMDAVAAELNREPRNAALKFRGDRFVVEESQEGQRLDAAATLSSLLAQTLGDRREVSLIVQRLRPAIVEENLHEAQALAEKIVSTPIVLRYGQRVWALGRSDLARMVVFEEALPGERGQVIARLDQAAAADFVRRIAAQVDQAPRDARFRRVGDKLEVLQESLPGQQIDVAGAVAAIAARAATADRTLPLKVETASPRVREADREHILVPDLLMDASTTYAGAVPAKKQNIELAASRLNGVAVPPGAVFSFNKALGPTTLDNGYQIGYGIVFKEGQPRTVPSVAGGICQVATTIFQAAFWAGLPMVERRGHLYWIARYGAPPRGLQGLDATVDEEYGVDFQFRNTTARWLLVESGTEGSTLWFRIYGVNPGWEVQVEGPVIAGVVKADRTVIQQEDPNMPAGQKLQIEAAEDGFQATIVRTVLREGQVVDRWVAKSRYAPARNVVLVGTKTDSTDSPKPSPSPSPPQEG